MTLKHTFIAAVGISVAALAAVAHSPSKEELAQDGLEKCYGVAKAGENDCGSKAAGHDCAGSAKTDADVREWLRVPQGLCEKLAGGVKKD